VAERITTTKDKTETESDIAALLNSLPLQFIFKY